MTTALQGLIDIVTRPQIEHTVNQYKSERRLEAAFAVVATALSVATEVLVEERERDGVASIGDPFALMREVAEKVIADYEADPDVGRDAS